MAEDTETEPLHRQLGMTDDELTAVIDELGREPTHLELAMYSVMWSEHCSYKSSRAFLSRFPTEAPWVLVGPGEGDVGHQQAGDAFAFPHRGGRVVPECGEVAGQRGDGVALCLAQWPGLLGAGAFVGVGGFAQSSRSVPFHAASSWSATSRLAGSTAR